MATITQADKAGREAMSPAPGRQVHQERSLNGRAGEPSSSPRPCSTSTMLTDSATGESNSAVSFDASAWLSNLVAIGGGYALASGRKLWLIVDKCLGDELTSVMSQVVGYPGRIEAVRVAIERHQAGETV